MSERIFSAFAAASLLFGVPGAASPQKIRVALSVAESDSSGVVESSVASALRSLRDVTVVSAAEPADYDIVIASACTGPEVSCTAALRGIAVYFSTRLDTASVTFAMIGSSIPLSERYRLAGRVADQLQGFGRVHQLTVLMPRTWGLRPELEAYVAQLDVKCFERSRLIKRLTHAAEAGDLERAEEIEAEVDRRTWLC